MIPCDLKKATIQMTADTDSLRLLENLSPDAIRAELAEAVRRVNALRKLLRVAEAAERWCESRRDRKADRAADSNPIPGGAS